MLPWWRPTLRTRRSFSTVAWWRNCSNRSWFCRFHFVLQRNCDARLLFSLPILFFLSYDKVSSTFGFDTKSLLESPRVIKRLRRHCGLPHWDISDSGTFFRGKLAEREWKLFVVFVVSYRLVHCWRSRRKIFQMLSPDQATVRAPVEDFLDAYRGCCQDR